MKMYNILKMAGVYLLHKSALNSTGRSDNPISSDGERMDRVQESETLMRVIVGVQISCDAFRSITIIIDYYFYRLAININHCEANSQSNLKYKQASIKQFLNFV
jgi:hypothetical protein